MTSFLMYFQPIYLLPVENKKIINKKQQIKTKRSPKEKIILTPQAEKFRNRIYRFISNGEKKIVRKELIYMFHEMVRQRDHSLRIICRNEYRSIKKYFNAFADQEQIIMKGLRELKEQGVLNQYLFCPMTLIKYT